MSNPGEQIFIHPGGTSKQSAEQVLTGLILHVSYQILELNRNCFHAAAPEYVFVFGQS